jgi:hypothetical protein
MRSLIDRQICYDITLFADWILISSRAGTTTLLISACCLAHSIIKMSSSRRYNQASKLDPLGAPDYCRLRPGNNQLIQGVSSLLKFRPRACATHIGGSKEVRQDPNVVTIAKNTFTDICMETERARYVHLCLAFLLNVSSS